MVSLSDQSLINQLAAEFLELAEAYVEKYGVGPFLVLDGQDFAGKTSAINLIREAINAAGGNESVVFTHDPNKDLPLAGVMRRAILHRDYGDLDDTTEFLCFLAARAELNKEVIRPGIESGKVVISDRYASTTFAYQVFGHELAPARHMVTFASEWNVHSQGMVMLLVDEDTYKARKAERIGSDEINHFDEKDQAHFDRIRKANDMLASETVRLSTFDSISDIDTSNLNQGQVAAAVLTRFKSALHELLSK